MYRYKAIVVDIIDNDTIKVAIDLGFGVVINQKVKLAGIDTSDLKNKLDKSNALKQHLTDNILNKELTLKSLKAEKSGKYLVFLYFDGQQKSFNDQLIEAGLVKAFVKREK